MTGFVTDSAGQVFQLPEALYFELEYGVGTPCDSFLLRCPWQAGNPTRPGDWVGFYAEQDGARVFTGVVDECEVSQGSQGCRLEVSGRGMAALLLDNEALGEDYDLATPEDIMADHVVPYGIELLPGTQLPAQNHFRVDTGSSEWTVLEQFVRLGGGGPIRFDAWGRLALSAWEDGEVLLLDGGVPVTGLARRDRRYGVLSQVLVRDRFSGTVVPVEHEEFTAAGGRARRVLTMPGYAGWSEMVQAGQEQLERAARERLEVEVTVAVPFYAMPGQLVKLERENFEADGIYRVARSVVGLDGDGYWTRLTLRAPECVR